ncbi:M48 family metallopeptidase [Actinoplanes hulinensis]|uniref:M48 family metallopeptidase n=1 Tax=Actinoplanes hulinensis TaxID=1144547 RepID=A0ABS7AUE3_9ACTN|nr:M48 family metallopeptidase [Actinoplanes hulinensis]
MAARSAIALAGFPVLAGLQLAAVLLLLWAVLSVLPSAVALRAGVPLSIATVGALGYETWRALHTRRRTPAGVAVTRRQAPKLWELIDGAAAAAGVRPPDGVTVVADATAALGERTRVLGLIGGRRDLYLGLPLLQALPPARLRAVVAHELAHGSPKLGRWAPLAYRGRVAVGRTAPRISRRNPAGAVLRAYARFYRRMDAPFSRAQELAADRIAADHAGVADAVAALRDLPALAGMQRLFHAEYLGPGWQAGYVPDDVFGGLLRVLAARSVEMSMLRAAEPEPSGPWDTHPPLAERVAALTPRPSPVAAAASSASDAASDAATASVGASSSATKEPASSETVSEEPETVSEEPETVSEEPEAVSEEPEAAAEEKPAEPDEELVPDLPALGRALQAVAFPPRGRTVVSWDECLSFARTTEMEREAEAALAAISRASDAAVPDAAHLLTLVADGRLRAAAGAVFPDTSPEEITARIVDLLGLMLALAALRGGVARWRHSWTGAAEVVAVDGANLNLAELAAAAADPETAEAVRTYLTENGFDLAARADRRASARARVLGGLVNLSADGTRTDLLITDLGLLLVPGLPRGRGVEAKRRLTRIAADGVPAGAEPPAEPDSDQEVRRFVPFADVAGVTVLPGRRKGWVLGLRDGGNLSLRPALDADELPGGWAAWEEAVTFLAGTR